MDWLKPAGTGAADVDPETGRDELAAVWPVSARMPFLHVKRTNCQLSTVGQKSEHRTTAYPVVLAQLWM